MSKVLNKKDNLTAEEKDILDSFERGEWQPVKNMAAEMRRYAKYATDTNRKNKRMNLRITQGDLWQLQTRAQEEGLPYQTLATSVLHRYLTGRLVEKEQT